MKQRNLPLRMSRLVVSDEQGIANLRAVWDRATEYERWAGARYWGNLQQTLLANARTVRDMWRGENGFDRWAHGATPLWISCTEERAWKEMLTGVFSALSPNNSEQNNIADFIALLLDGEQARLRTYKACKARALRILEGEPAERVLGRKTGSMWRNLVDPQDVEAVTVDGHMVGMWRGERLTMDQAGTNAEEYAQVVRGVKVLAGQLGRDGIREERSPLVPSGVQATLWLAWRRIHDVQQKAATQEELEAKGQRRLGL